MQLSVVLLGVKKSKEKIEGRKIKLKQMNTAQMYTCGHWCRNHAHTSERRKISPSRETDYSLLHVCSQPSTYAPFAKS